MQTTTRRTLIKTLMGLPVISWAAKSWLFGWTRVSANEDDTPNERKFLAVKVIRLINTAQRRYFEVARTYTDLTSLWKSEQARELVASKGAERAGLGQTLYSRLDFAQREVTPGWSLEFKLRDNKSGYLVRITDVSGQGMGAFASDQNAVIYEGSPAVIGFDPNKVGAAAMVAGNPIGHISGDRRAEGGTVTSFLRAVAFGPVLVRDILAVVFAVARVSM